MKARVRVAVRRQGRAVGHEGRPAYIYDGVLGGEVTDPIVVSVSIAEIKRALYMAGARDDGLDTLEVTVHIEEDA